VSKVSSGGKPPDEIDLPSGMAVLGCRLWDFLATLAKYTPRRTAPDLIGNYTTRKTAPTLYVLSFPVFQLLFRLREFADLNAACFCFCVMC
jgi:hypothetical protein